MTPAQFERRVAKDMARLQKNVENSIRKTARQAVPVIAKHVPIAFGELKHSIHAESKAGPGHVASTIVDAPHAAAVEVGSRPHLVPIDELIAWVKLRGTQGLTKTGRIRTKRWNPAGSTTRAHAIRVAQQLRAKQSGGALGIDAPEQVAHAIQMAILRAGTKPHWYTAKSMAEIERILKNNVDAALSKSTRKGRKSQPVDDGIIDGVLEDAEKIAGEEMIGEVVESFPLLPSG